MAARRRLAAKDRPAPLKLGTIAAQALALAKPLENKDAKDWVVRDPANRTHRVRNLKWWLTQQLGREEGTHVYVGLRQVALSLRGKRKHPISHAKGWRLLCIPSSPKRPEQ